MRGETSWLASDSSTSEDGRTDRISHLSKGLSHVNLKERPVQQEDPPLDEGENALWELRPSPGKGIGMFAKSKILRGTRILADRCLINLPQPKALLTDIERAFDQLSPSQQKAYMELHCPDRPGRSPVVRIWEANCFRVDEGAGIFLKASRINHSCTPNAHFAWNANIQRETVHAIVDIPASKEIFISYCYPHTDIYHRQQKLEPYGFDCDCRPCSQDTPSGRTSEACRRRIDELAQKIEEIRNDPMMVFARYWRDDELQARLELIDRLEEEKLFQLELANQYHCVATCYEYRGEKSEALTWANKGIQITLRCVGPDSEMFQNDRARIQELERGDSE